MSMTPLHPLTSKESLTRDEWLELLAYTGLVAVSSDCPDMDTLRTLESDGLVSIAAMHGQFGVCLTAQSQQ